jgi:hypothetical protein
MSETVAISAGATRARSSETIARSLGDERARSSPGALARSESARSLLEGSAPRTGIVFENGTP